MDDLQGRFSLEAAIPVVLIVKELEVLRVGSEVAITPEPLAAKESPVVGIIEALHGSMTPGFSNRDEDHLDSHGQAKPEHDTKGTKITIASPETEIVVDLKEIRKTHCLPTMDQSQSHSLVVSSSLGIDKDAMTVQIHDMERKEVAIVFDVSWTQKVCLAWQVHVRYES